MARSASPPYRVITVGYYRLPDVDGTPKYCLRSSRWVVHDMTVYTTRRRARPNSYFYGGACPKLCYTAFILPPTKSFYPYKITPESEGGVT